MVHVVIDAFDAAVVCVLVVGLLLCGIVLAAIWVKQELDKRQKK